MAPQNFIFNPRSLTFDHVLFDVSHVANTETIYNSIVSDRELKCCGAISGRAIFFISTLFVLHQGNKTSPTNYKAVSSTHFRVFVKISLFFVNYFVAT
jgi:hypothetical protein